MTNFEEGVFYAAALLVTFSDQPTLAVDVLEQASLLESDISGLDDTERAAMILLLQGDDERVKFTGISVECIEGLC